ncbi:Ankyrin repeat and KH domain-containing protein mask [Diplonema papillatum]|nr:Ankyrin repeat and KH domain-containing protein mask [Diplonema papillatum]
MSLCEPTDLDDVAGRFNYACQMGSLERVQAIVNECKITNFDLLDQYGSPPLYNAAMKSDNVRLVVYLLDKGATVGLRNSENETPLFIAVYNDHIEVAKKLIERGAKPDEKGGVYGDTPLHVCVKNNHPTMANYLIAQNVNVNARNDQGETPLWLACKLDRKQLAYTLLMNKANKSLQADGKDCLYVASENRNQDIVRLLKCEGPAEMMSVKQAFSSGKADAATKKDDWREVAFKHELDNLGITEESAARKPRVLPKAQRRKQRTGPRPLFDSDEEDDEREERLRREEAARPPPQVLRYQDPEGTTYNPTGALHLQDVQHAKEMFRKHPSHFAEGPRKQPPPPGLVEADDNDDDDEAPAQAQWATDVNQPVPRAAAANPAAAAATAAAAKSGKPNASATLPRHGHAAAAPAAAAALSSTSPAASKVRTSSNSRKVGGPKRDNSRGRVSGR